MAASTFKSSPTEESYKQLEAIFGTFLASASSVSYKDNKFFIEKQWILTQLREKNFTNHSLIDWFNQNPAFVTYICKDSVASNAMDRLLSLVKEEQETKLTAPPTIPTTTEIITPHLELKSAPSWTTISFDSSQIHALRRADQLQIWKESFDRIAEMKVAELELKDCQVDSTTIRYLMMLASHPSIKTWYFNNCNFGFYKPGLVSYGGWICYFGEIINIANKHGRLMLKFNQFHHTDSYDPLQYPAEEWKHDPIQFPPHIRQLHLNDIYFGSIEKHRHLLSDYDVDVVTASSCIESLVFNFNDMLPKKATMIRLSDTTLAHDLSSLRGVISNLKKIKILELTNIRFNLEEDDAEAFRYGGKKSFIQDLQRLFSAVENHPTLEHFSLSFANPSRQIICEAEAEVQKQLIVGNYLLPLRHQLGRLGLLGGPHKIIMDYVDPRCRFFSSPITSQQSMNEIYCYRLGHQI